MKSRFAPTRDDDPGEGGVRAARTRSARPPVSANGVPGPEETLLDITELVRTVGMRYIHRFALPPEAEPEIGAVSPLVGEITLTNAGAALLLQGKARVQMEMECTRCLALTVQEVATDLEEQFTLLTTHTAFRQEEVQAVDENAEAPVISGNVLNLGELLRQSLLLAAPALPTCAEDCRAQVRWSSTGAADAAPAENPLQRLGTIWASREQDQ